MGALLGPTRFRRGAKIEQFLKKSIGTLPEKTSKFDIFSMPKQEA
jgi:hypothetical protein